MECPFFQEYFQGDASRYLDRLIRLALEEDGPDLTALGTFAPDAAFHAVIVAKEETPVAGLPLVPRVYAACNAPCVWTQTVEEGQIVPAGTVVCHIRSNAVSVLKTERVILNFLTHLSGIAALTRRYVRALEGTGVRLLDTRKTLPGLRYPEKYAVRMGGGCNHRLDLTRMLMLKDTHIDAAGSIIRAVRRLRDTYGHSIPLEVECRTLDDVREAVSAGADRIMMDNMDIATLSQALPLVPPHQEAEVSGGVTLENIRALALASPRRPDFISVGRLTHSAPVSDFSMRYSKE